MESSGIQACSGWVESGKLAAMCPPDGAPPSADGAGHNYFFRGWRGVGTHVRAALDKDAMLKDPER